MRTWHVTASAMAFLALATAGPSIVAGPAAFAAGPAATVTPASGLRDGQTVKTVASGFPKGTTVYVSQCNDTTTGAEPSCDFADAVALPADSTGGVSTELTVRLSFDGINPRTGKATGRVDCGIANSCEILVAGGTPAAPIFAPPVLIGFGK